MNSRKFFQYLSIIMMILTLNGCDTCELTGTCEEDCGLYDECVDLYDEDTYSNSSQTDYAGEGSLCAYNYPEEACDSVCSGYSTTCYFRQGSGSSTCGSTRYDSQYDYGYSQSDGVGSVGACIVSY